MASILGMGSLLGGTALAAKAQKPSQGALVVQALSKQKVKVSEKAITFRGMGIRTPGDSKPDSGRTDRWSVKVKGTFYSGTISYDAKGKPTITINER